MALNLLEAAKVSRNPLMRGVLQAIATTDELISQIPMVPKGGESFVYDREKALPSVEYVSPTHSSIAESSATFDKVTVPMRMIVSDVDVYLFTMDQMQDENQQMGIQVEKKLKALGRQLGSDLIAGSYATSVTLSPTITGVASPAVNAWQDSDRHGPGSVRFIQATPSLEYRAPGDRTYGPAVTVSSNGTYTLKSDNPSRTLTVVVTTASLPGANTEVVVYIASTSNKFDGVQQFVPSAQTIDSTATDGDPLSFDVLDQLIDEKVKERANRFFIMNAAMKRKYFSLVRALGGANPEHIQLDGLNRPVPVYRSIPILQNDWIPSTEAKGAATTLSSVYLANLAPEEGLYFGVGQGKPGAEFDGDPRRTRILGVQLRDVGELEGKEARRTRLSWYGAAALGSELSIARARQLITA